MEGIWGGQEGVVGTYVTYHGPKFNSNNFRLLLGNLHVPLGGGLNRAEVLVVLGDLGG